METAAEAFPEAAAILAEAGWAPHPEWRLYTRDTRVAGITPDGTSLNVKNWAMITPDDPRYGPDTPDTAEEAAGWLVAWHNARAVVMTTDATLDPISLSGMSEAELAPPPEPEQDSAHEGDGETGEEAGSANAPAEDEAGDVCSAPEPYLADDAAAGSAGGDEGATWTAGVQPDLIDADFTDLPELGQEIAEEHPEEHASGAFIFGDNLDQKRTAAIGLVMQAAIARMPPWNDTDTARLSELRNFAMGVSEGRWNDDPGSREWLNELETRLRRRSQIVAHRDGLVEFLNTATRDEIEGFDPEAGWP